MVVINDHRQVLCLQKADDPNFWQSVTGSMQSFETPRACAVRELEEETGYTRYQGWLNDCCLQWWYDIFPERLKNYPPGTKRNLEHVFVYRCYQPNRLRLSQEHSQFEWLEKQDAIARMPSWSNRQAIQLFV